MRAMESKESVVSAPGKTGAMLLRLEVSVARQEVRVIWRDGRERVFPVSTSRFGLGTEEGSFRTPLGRFRIAEKIGAGAPLWSVFRRREATGEIAHQGGAEDLVLSRIFWLEGLDPENANTKERYIYFHGTNQEHLIGQAASHGCIRLRNADMVELFDLVPEGTQVVIRDDNPTPCEPSEGWTKPLCGISMAVLLGILFLVGCEEAKPLRVAMNDWPGYSFLHVAKSKGYFTEQEVEVEIIHVEGLQDGRRALELGHVDGVATTTVELLLSSSMMDTPPQVVALINFSDGADVLLAEESHASIRSLMGAKVGLEKKSLGAYLLHRALQKEGLTLQDVQCFWGTQDVLAEAYQKGEIDALVTYPPYLEKLEKQRPSRKLFTSREIPGEILDVLVVSQEMVRDHPDAVQGMLRGFHRAKQLWRENPAEFFSALAASGFPSPASGKEKAYFEGLKIPTAEEQVRLVQDGTLQRVLRESAAVLQENGELEESIDTVLLVAPLEFFQQKPD